jgi:hypothetical protein
LKKKDAKDQISIKSQAHVLKIKHYEHNIVSASVKNEAPQAQHYKEEREQLKEY